MSDYERDALVELLTSIRAGRDGNLQPRGHYRRWAEVDADTILASEWLAERDAHALDEYADHVMAEVARWDERVYPNRWINAREKAAAARSRAAALRDEPTP